MTPMKALLLAIALLLALLSTACAELGTLGRGSDDDDSAAGDDDDDSADDDDDGGDDDDTAGGPGPGDDDDSAGDDDVEGDDDSAADPGTAFVHALYCLDWNTVTFQSPPDLVSILASFGVSLNDYPLLMSPTGVSIPVHEILMVMAATMVGTCNQDTSHSTYDLTATQAGSYTSPHFTVGPSDINLSTPLGDLALYETVFQGDFTGDATSVVNGTISGRLDVSAYRAVLCNNWNCSPCPTGSGDCVDLLADGAVWTDNGQGPMTIVP